MRLCGYVIYEDGCVGERCVIGDGVCEGLYEISEHVSSLMRKVMKLEEGRILGWVQRN